MGHAPLLEHPLVVRTRPAVDMDAEHFSQFCQLNRDLRMERTAEGDILIMTPESGSSGHGSAKLNALFDQWSERDGTGQVFGSSTGCNQNGAQLGWLLDPVAKRVYVYRPGAAVEVLTNPPRVSGEPLLRGFVLDVPQIWAAMKREKS